MYASLEPPSRQELQNYKDQVRANLSDIILWFRFRYILYQCKYQNRPDKVLLEYINELEYRGLKYRI